MGKCDNLNVGVDIMLKYVLIAAVGVMCSAMPMKSEAATESYFSYYQTLSAYSPGNWTLVGMVNLNTGVWGWSSWFYGGTQTVQYTLPYDVWLFGAVWDDLYNDWGEGLYLIDRNM
jgi:hypothetical protein